MPYPNPLRVSGRIEFGNEDVSGAGIGLTGQIAVRHSGNDWIAGSIKRNPTDRVVGVCAEQWAGIVFGLTAQPVPATRM